MGAYVPRLGDTTVGPGHEAPLGASKPGAPSSLKLPTGAYTSGRDLQTFSQKILAEARGLDPSGE